MNTEIKYVGFWVRGTASSIDGIIVMVISLVLTYFVLAIAYIVLKPAPTFGEAFTGGFIQVINLGASVFVGIPYYVGFHRVKGWTIGKKILGFKVVDEKTLQPLTTGQSVWRYVGTWVSGLLLGAGYLMAAWNFKKKALHDMMAGTVSIYM